MRYAEIRACSVCSAASLPMSGVVAAGKLVPASSSGYLPETDRMRYYIAALNSPFAE